MQAKSIFLVATVVFVVIVFFVGQPYPQAPKDWNGQPVKAEDERCWNSSVESRMDMIAKSSKHNWKNHIFYNFPTNKDDDKSKSILFQKSLQLVFGEVTQLVG